MNKLTLTTLYAVAFSAFNVFVPQSDAQDDTALRKAAQEDAQFVTAMNGVKVELKGTFDAPNNIIIQAELPIFEFEGLQRT